MPGPRSSARSGSKGTPCRAAGRPRTTPLPRPVEARGRSPCRPPPPGRGATEPRGGPPAVRERRRFLAPLMRERAHLAAQRHLAVELVDHQLAEGVRELGGLLLIG